MKKYYRISGYMEMLQSAFRTKEGAILLNIDKADKERVQRRWAWNQNFEWRSFDIKNQQKRIGKLLAQNVISEEPVYPAELKVDEIREEIENLFEIYLSLSKTKLQEKVSVGSAEEIIRVRDEMIEEGRLEVEKDGKTDWVSISL